jgi:hypothetical protein
MRACFQVALISHATQVQSDANLEPLHPRAERIGLIHIGTTDADCRAVGHDRRTHSANNDALFTSNCASRSQSACG